MGTRRLTASLLLIGTLAAACGSTPDGPSGEARLTTLTIEASSRCAIGTDALPFATYTVVMRDRRDEAAWFFSENRDPGGSREIQLTIQLTGPSSTLTGTLSGPAIVTASGARYWVFPSGRVSAMASATEVTGTFDGSLSAYPYGSTATHPRCEAPDHRFRLTLPSGAI